MPSLSTLWILVVVGIIAEYVYMQNKAKEHNLTLSDLLETKSEPIHFIINLIGVALFGAIIYASETGIMNILAWIGLVMSALGFLYNLYRLSKPTPEEWQQSNKADSNE
jgi:hypothetical protein